ncbi:MAG: hypothetical protein CL678_10185 [Bdellovibrionaceae bacterium]|nr:hypothetical protein [Pseudobdellovibrionaceae bacterium]|tara:strand:+ start:2399 stop:3163 length:765 start_codon:yes stop_codon:yes gene_type:complete
MIRVLLLSLWWIPALIHFIFFNSSNTNWNNILKAPQFTHFYTIAGYDSFGRPLLFQLFDASIYSLLFTAIAVTSIVLLSTVNAMLLLNEKNFFSKSIHTMNHFFISFPSLLIALCLSTFFESGALLLLTSICLGTVPLTSRFIFVHLKKILNREYYISGKSLGQTQWGFFQFYFFPEIVQLIKLKLPQLFAGTLIAESTFTFLGIGSPLGSLTWGSLFLEGKDYLLEAPHIAIATGLPLIWTLVILYRWNKKEF